MGCLLWGSPFFVWGVFGVTNFTKVLLILRKLGKAGESRGISLRFPEYSPCFHTKCIWWCQKCIWWNWWNERWNWWNARFTGLWQIKVGEGRCSKSSKSGIDTRFRMFVQ